MQRGWDKEIHFCDRCTHRKALASSFFLFRLPHPWCLLLESKGWKLSAKLGIKLRSYSANPTGGGIRWWGLNKVWSCSGRQNYWKNKSFYSGRNSFWCHHLKQYPFQSNFWVYWDYSWREGSDVKPAAGYKWPSDQLQLSPRKKYISTNFSGISMAGSLLCPERRIQSIGLNKNNWWS